MSNIYIQEPPTEGKVLLETTVGDIDIELWSRECPKACRNFIQLCMEGYYDRTIFHRLVKGFIVQGGDPSGTGNGGDSIWDKPFKDEFHSRLRFARRGLVAMANAGKDDNGSQFFFTLGPTQELQNKHTLFGKVGGNTIYNMIKLEEGDVDDNERPQYPHKILRTKILSNPFDDIVPRVVAKREEKKSKSKQTAAATKNYSLLSFGEEAEEEEEQVDVVNKKFTGKSKSSHDLIQDPKLSNLPAVTAESLSIEKKTKDNEKNEDESSEEKEESSEKEKDQLTVSTVQEKFAKARNDLKKPSKKSSKSSSKPKSDSDEEYYLGKDDKIKEKERIEAIKKEYKDLKRSMKSEKEAVSKSKAQSAAEEAEKEEANSLVKEFFDEQKHYKEKRSAIKGGDSREAQTLALLEKFKNKIASAKETCPEADKEVVKDEVQDNPEDISWLAKSLHNEVEENVLAKDANRKDDDWYEIYDPKNPLNKRRRGEDNKKGAEEKWKKLRPTD